jgi:hypothetical protein
MHLWCRTLGPADTQFELPKEVLRQSLDSFRDRVAQLIATLGAELPMLTVHDVTHLDALWRVADQVAGNEYPINPAEAFVLGGAILLHDAAHVLAAYPEGLANLKKLFFGRISSPMPPKSRKRAQRRNGFWFFGSCGTSTPPRLRNWPAFASAARPLQWWLPCCLWDSNRTPKGAPFEAAGSPFFESLFDPAKKIPLPFPSASTISCGRQIYVYSTKH